jgi:hypothetical protein
MTLSTKALASDNEDPNDVEKPRVHLAEEALINLIGASVAHGHPWPSNGTSPPANLLSSHAAVSSLPRFNPARKKETFPFPDIPNPNL